MSKVNSAVEVSLYNLRHDSGWVSDVTHYLLVLLKFLEYSQSTLSIVEYISAGFVYVKMFL